MGETENAIADFQFAIDALNSLDNPAATPYVEQRQEWIDALAAGEDPFTDEVLAMLQKK